jgi:chromosome segregation ATPase
MTDKNTSKKNIKKKEIGMPGSRSVLSPEVKRQIVTLIDKRIKEAHVTKEDFSELKSIVKEIAIAQSELADAQKRTEQKVAELSEAQKLTEKRIAELTEAQKRTEQRLSELAEAQKRTEQRVDALSQKVEQLADAQKLTEERIAELTEAQKRTEQRLSELAEAQKRTEQRVDALSQKVEQLADAQKRTDERVAELAEAQKRTEQRLSELAEAQKRTEQRVDALSQKMEQLAEAQRKTEVELAKLAIEFKEVKIEIGGLSRSFSYAFENEAYRNLPKVLKEKYGFEIIEQILRADIGGKEINFFGKARKDNLELYIVGESKLRIESDWRMDVFSELEEKVAAVKSEYGDIPIVQLLVTHYAKKSFIDEALKRGVIIVQSFEW